MPAPAERAAWRALPWLLAMLLTVAACNAEPAQPDGGPGEPDAVGDAATPPDASEDRAGGDAAGDAPSDLAGDAAQDGDAALDLVGDVPGDLTADGSAPFEVTEDDFECLLRWELVRSLRITNIRGQLEQALAVADSPDGGLYPEGTIIQIIPGEAMVKRHAGFSPKSNDWEFFSLGVSAKGTTIRSRGTTGTSCFGCHAEAEPRWDFVCEDDHGCAPVGITDEVIAAAQQNDPRCP